MLEPIALGASSSRAGGCPAAGLCPGRPDMPVVCGHTHLGPEHRWRGREAGLGVGGRVLGRHPPRSFLAVGAHTKSAEPEPPPARRGDGPEHRSHRLESQPCQAATFEFKPRFLQVWPPGLTSHHGGPQPLLRGSLVVGQPWSHSCASRGIRVTGAPGPFSRWSLQLGLRS